MFDESAKVDFLKKKIDAFIVSALKNVLNRLLTAKNLFHFAWENQYFRNHTILMKMKRWKKWLFWANIFRCLSDGLETYSAFMFPGFWKPYTKTKLTQTPNFQSLIILTTSQCQIRDECKFLIRWLKNLTCETNSPWK